MLLDLLFVDAPGDGLYRHFLLLEVSTIALTYLALLIRNLLLHRLLLLLTLNLQLFLANLLLFVSLHALLNDIMHPADGYRCPCLRLTITHVSPGIIRLPVVALATFSAFTSLAPLGALEALST